MSVLARGDDLHSDFSQKKILERLDALRRAHQLTFSGAHIVQTPLSGKKS